MKEQIYLAVIKRNF